MKQRRTKIEGPTRTATEAYREVATEIETLMEALAEALERHDAEHLERSWADVGDTKRVRDLLRGALAAARCEFPPEVSR